jgi:hypothetical protein
MKSSGNEELEKMVIRSCWGIRQPEHRRQYLMLQYADMHRTVGLMFVTSLSLSKENTT